MAFLDELLDWMGAFPFRRKRKPWRHSHATARREISIGWNPYADAGWTIWSAALLRHTLGGQLRVAVVALILCVDDEMIYRLQQDATAINLRMGSGGRLTSRRCHEITWPSSEPASQRRSRCSLEASLAWFNLPAERHSPPKFSSDIPSRSGPSASEQPDPLRGATDPGIALV